LNDSVSIPENGTISLNGKVVVKYLIGESAKIGGRGLIEVFCSSDIELRLYTRWVGGNIGSTDAKKTCHNLNAYIFETINNKVINNTPLDSLYSLIHNKTSFNPPSLNPSIQ
jgi:hypothetical protein